MTGKRKRAFINFSALNGRLDLGLYIESRDMIVRTGEGTGSGVQKQSLDKTFRLHVALQMESLRSQKAQVTFR